MLYQLCEKLAQVRGRWFVQASACDPVGVRARLADRLFVSTLRADWGARHGTHVADCERVRVMARLMRSDMTPAAAVEYLDGPF